MIPVTGVLVGAQAGVLAILVYSAVHKWRRPAQLAEALRGFGFGGFTQDPVLLAIPAIEVAAGLLGVVFLPWGSVGTLLVFAIYLGISVRALSSGEGDFKCACLHESESVSWFTAVRAGTLALVCAAPLVLRAEFTWIDLASPAAVVQAILGFVAVVGLTAAATVTVDLNRELSRFLSAN